MPMAMGPPLAVAVCYEIGADLLHRELKGQALALGGAQALAGLVDPGQCGAELARRRVERQGGGCGRCVSHASGVVSVPLAFLRGMTGARPPQAPWDTSSARPSPIRP